MAATVSKLARTIHPLHKPDPLPISRDNRKEAPTLCYPNQPEWLPGTAHDHAPHKLLLLRRGHTAPHGGDVGSHAGAARLAFA
jgi:hypothetical protein